MASDLVQDVMRVIRTAGARGLRVDDLTREDVPLLGWSGSAMHLASVVRALDRVELAELEYLAVRAPTGEPIAKCAIDYAKAPGTGWIYQVATAAELQGHGIGTCLIVAAEERIRQREVCVAELGVEDNNPRARALYERLGYREVRRERASWDQQDADGNLARYETELAVLRKEL
jgi:ribosomal protein S18 acetylase RimI-like enzyme